MDLRIFFLILAASILFPRDGFCDPSAGSPPAQPPLSASETGWPPLLEVTGGIYDSNTASPSTIPTELSAVIFADATNSKNQFAAVLTPGDQGSYEYDLTGLPPGTYSVSVLYFSGLVPQMIPAPNPANASGTYTFQARPDGTPIPQSFTIPFP